MGWKSSATHAGALYLVGGIAAEAGTGLGWTTCGITDTVSVPGSTPAEIGLRLG